MIRGENKQQARSIKQALSWYRGPTTNWYPKKKELRSIEQQAANTILKGWLPEKPFIVKKTPVAAFGSCFAVNIVKHLRSIGFNALGQDKKAQWGPTFCNVAVVNTETIRQQLKWAWTGWTPSEDVWYTGPGSAAPTGEEARAATRRVLNAAEVFIITVGLSEVWYSKKSGEVFWQAVPGEMFDKDKHGFRVLEFEENVSNLETIRSMIRRRKPNVPIVFTLSPIPLKATFRPVSCVTANTASKAVLRAALDRFMRRWEGDGALYYWPSYELVQAFPDPWLDDARHLKPGVLQAVMRLFDRHYLVRPKK